MATEGGSYHGPANHIGNCTTKSHYYGISGSSDHTHHCTKCGGEPSKVKKHRWDHGKYGGTTDWICAIHGEDGLHPENKAKLAKQTNYVFEYPMWM